MDRSELDDQPPAAPSAGHATGTGIVTDPTVVLVPPLAIATTLVVSTPGWVPLATWLCVGAWSVLLVVWLAALGRGSARRKDRPFWPVAVLPGFLAIVAVLAATNLPLRARFALSRDALDETAGAVLGAQATEPSTRIGSFPVQSVETDGRSVWFVTHGFGSPDRWGIVFSPEPPVPASGREVIELEPSWFAFHEGGARFPLL